MKKATMYRLLGVALALVVGFYVYNDYRDAEYAVDPEKGYKFVDDGPLWKTSGDFGLVED